MIIALTAAEEPASELHTIHALFDQGLDLLHLRKYHFTDAQMYRYIASIETIYHDRLVLHSHPHLSDKLSIQRIHLNECNRQSGLFKQHLSTCICSTSVHHINQFNALGRYWAYAFLSPIFPSISKKGYGQEHTVSPQLEFRTNFDVNLIGLGGLKQDNCFIPIQSGANGIALFGALWQHPDPLQHFIKCKQALSKDYSISHKD